jgi:hypothetical protein
MTGAKPTSSIAASAQGPGCVKTQNSRRDENDILRLDFKIEWLAVWAPKAGLNE